MKVYGGIWGYMEVYSLPSLHLSPSSLSSLSLTLSSPSPLSPLPPLLSLHSSPAPHSPPMTLAPQMFCTCLGHVWDVFGPCIGHVCGMFGSCVDQGCNICRVCLGQCCKQNEEALPIKTRSEATARGRDGAALWNEMRSSGTMHA